MCFAKYSTATPLLDSNSWRIISSIHQDVVVNANDGRRSDSIVLGEALHQTVLSEAKHIAGYAVRLLVVFLLAGVLSAADEWPQFRGNPQLTGVASSTVASSLKLLWTYEAGESIE